MPPNSPILQLTSSTDPLRTTTPHLMPFHIEHTGPAPLSTYFLVKPALPEPQSDATFVQRVKARFVAAFRGRTMQGLAVDLPEGYSGVVFCSEDKGKRREGEDMGRKQPAKQGRRSMRNSKKNGMPKDEHGDATMEMQVEEEAEAEMIQTLRPTAKFTSFTLWNADVNVDEEADEYLRFLAEYQRLFAEVNRVP